MRTEPRWILKQALLLLHQESLATFGGATGIRDEGLPDSALARPLHTTYNPDCTIADLAAAYGFGLAKNHAFVDGNKRAAFLAIGVFLPINGYRLTPSQPEAIRAILALAASEWSEPDLAHWIARHIAPLSPR